jgi:cytochrome P450
MHVDLADPKLLFRDDVLADPRPLYDFLRRNAPVWRIPGQDSYLVSDPALIRDAIARTAEFSSNLVSLLHRDASGDPVPFALTPFGDPIHVLATADPPIHTRHRRFVQPHLNAFAIAPLEPTIRTLCERQLAPLLDAGGGDAVAHLADPVPALTLCHLAGLPLDEATQLIPLVAAISPLLDGLSLTESLTAAAEAVAALHAYAESRLADVSARPPAERGGLLGVFADGIDAGALTKGEVRDILIQLFTAGTETTSSLTANAIELLARRPEAQAELRADPGRIPDALDDLLRDDGPFQFHYRWSTADTVLGGVPIPASSRLLLMWAAANRPAPDGHADAGDASGVHYAFGRGLHFCVGAPLARLESRIAIETLLARTASFTLDEARPPTRRPSIMLRRHASLHVVVARA